MYINLSCNNDNANISLYVDSFLNYAHVDVVYNVLLVVRFSTGGNCIL